MGLWGRAISEVKESMNVAGRRAGRIFGSGNQGLSKVLTPRASGFGSETSTAAWRRRVRTAGRARTAAAHTCGVADAAGISTYPIWVSGVARIATNTGWIAAGVASNARIGVASNAGRRRRRAFGADISRMYADAQCA